MRHLRLILGLVSPFPVDVLQGPAGMGANHLVRQAVVVPPYLQSMVGRSGGDRRRSRELKSDALERPLARLSDILSAGVTSLDVKAAVIVGIASRFTRQPTPQLWREFERLLALLVRALVILAPKVLTVIS